jgi:diamine N-acetyltransferase
MPQIEFKFIESENITVILPLMRLINTKTPEKLLEERIKEMASQNYKCLGVFDGEKLIGICGLWYMTRHYCGRSIEADHVIILDEYKNKGIGNQLFDWIFDYAKAENIEASELNTYVENPRSHKFYYNLGYEIKGFHFVKNLI